MKKQLSSVTEELNAWAEELGIDGIEPIYDDDLMGEASSKFVRNLRRCLEAVKEPS